MGQTIHPQFQSDLPGGAPDYLVDIARHAKPGACSISDYRLAAGLGHTKRTASTLLLETTLNSDGQSYGLCLAGYIEWRDHATNTVFDQSCISESQIDALESGANGIAVEHSPWFEWVDEDGNPVGDVFDAISLDAPVEIGRLEQMFALPKPAPGPCKIEVFHLRDDVPWSQRDELCDNIDAVQAAYSNGGYRHVATCHVPFADDPVVALEEAFRLTNNIDSSWVETHACVEVAPPVLQEGGCRSTSIGDLMRLNGVMYQVRSAGFAAIDGFSH